MSMIFFLKDYFKKKNKSLYLLLRFIFLILNLKLHFKKITQTKIVYKTLPKLFLFSKFGLINNINSKKYWNNKHSNKLINPEETELSKNLYSILKKNLNFYKKDILDIGCGNGVFLNSIDVDCNLYGADLSNHILNNLKNKNITIYPLNLPDISLNKKFDIVTCFETLEHVSMWKKSIKNMIKLLKPNAHLCISVPFEDAIVIKEHVNYFDVQRLYTFIKKQKLYVAEIKIIGSWLLIVSINRNHQPRTDKIISYFKC